MQSLRRLYLYAVAFVSLEIVLWGSIGLTRSFFDRGSAAGSANQLAQALSLILVGVPVFLLHWWLAQRAALREPGERSALLRAIFLYGVLSVTLVPVANNTLSLLDRLLAMLFGIQPTLAPLGGMQTFSDNLIAITLNALAAVYFYTLLVADWKAVPLGNDYAVVRRLYRYLGLVYWLVLAGIGVQRIIEYLLRLLSPAASPDLALLSSGLALLLVGVPLWLLTGWIISRSLDEAGERGSLLRWVVLIGVVLASAVVGLFFMLVLLQILLEEVLGRGSTPAELIDEVAMTLSIGIAFGAAWVYYSRLLRKEKVYVSGLAFPETKRFLLLRRIQAYVMTLFGLTAAVLGLQVLLDDLLDLSLPGGMDWEQALMEGISFGMAALIVGLPVWILNWRPLRREAAAEGESGDEARRSVIRRGYLYLVLFAGVMGVMFSTGALIYQLLRALLGESTPDLLYQTLAQLKTMLVFAALLAYHAWVLRQDNRLIERLLARRRAQYPVLVLAPSQGGFAETLVAALQREAPGLPVAVHPIEGGAPDETFSAAEAVILPSDLLVKPSEALRLWLASFDGKRLVIPVSSEDWQWVQGGQSLPAQARRAARMARRLAEGED
jgi:Domain of unknown function (DUF5671)